MVVGILIVLMLMVVAAVSRGGHSRNSLLRSRLHVFRGRLTPAIGEFVWDKSKEFILVACRCSSCSARSC